MLTGEAPSFTESHASWAQPYRVGVVAIGIRMLFKYVYAADVY